MSSLARRSPAEPQPGDIIGAKYSVERLLGVGGMGRVLAAKHLTTGKRVALKWILNEESPEALERFRREASAAGRIHHANVVAVYDVIEHEGATCLVMEHLQGESLADCLARELRLPVEAAARIVVHVLRGLHAAHAEGVIHRDLKPGNLFLTRGQGDAGVKILDFGISKITGGDVEPVTKTGAVVGTPHYMAPEQVMGRGTNDGQSDVYSLGAVLYEMVAGRPPHVNDRITALLVEIATIDPTPLSELDPSLPAGFSDVVMKALAKPLEQRFATVAEFARALEPFAGGMRFDPEGVAPAAAVASGRPAAPAARSNPSIVDTMAAARPPDSKIVAVPRLSSPAAGGDDALAATQAVPTNPGGLSVGADASRRRVALLGAAGLLGVIGIGALLTGRVPDAEPRDEPAGVSVTVPVVAETRDEPARDDSAVPPAVVEERVEGGAAEAPPETPVEVEAAPSVTAPSAPASSAALGRRRLPRGEEPPPAATIEAPPEPPPAPAPEPAPPVEPAPVAAEAPADVEDDPSPPVAPRAGRIGLDDF